MHSQENEQSTHSWPKSILNSFLLWLAATVFYLAPGFVVAIPMGFDLGPKLKDSAQVGKMIGQAVSEMYSSNLYIHYGYVALLVALIFWRSRVISRRVSTKSLVHGALVASVPLVFTALPLLLAGHVILGAVAAVAFPAAGLAGSLNKTPNTAT